MVCLLELSGVGLAQAEPERSEPQYVGIINNIATRVSPAKCPDLEAI